MGTGTKVAIGALIAFSAAAGVIHVGVKQDEQRKNQIIGLFQSASLGDRLKSIENKVVWYECPDPATGVKIQVFPQTPAALNETRNNPRCSLETL